MAEITLDMIMTLLKDMQNKMRDQDEYFDEIVARLVTLDARFNGLDRRFAAMHRRLDHAETRFDAIHQRLDNAGS